MILFSCFSIRQKEVRNQSQFAHPDSLCIQLYSMSWWIFNKCCSFSVLWKWEPVWEHQTTVLHSGVSCWADADDMWQKILSNPKCCGCRLQRGDRPRGPSRSSWDGLSESIWTGTPSKTMKPAQNNRLQNNKHNRQKHIGITCCQKMGDYFIVCVCY